jgi:hypothetical protein
MFRPSFSVVRRPSPLAWVCHVRAPAFPRLCPPAVPWTSDRSEATREDVFARDAISSASKPYAQSTHISLQPFVAYVQPASTTAANLRPSRLPVPLDDTGSFLDLPYHRHPCRHLRSSALVYPTGHRIALPQDRAGPWVPHRWGNLFLGDFATVGFADFGDGSFNASSARSRSSTSVQLLRIGWWCTTTREFDAVYPSFQGIVESWNYNLIFPSWSI